MNRLAHKQHTSVRRTHKVRTIIGKHSARPRLSVNISNLHVSAQIVDDAQGKTLSAASSVGAKVEGNLTAKAAWVGGEIAKKAKAAKIQQVVFDRGSRKYHGRVKALADAARAAGLEF